MKAVFQHTVVVMVLTLTAGLLVPCHARSTAERLPVEPQRVKAQITLLQGLASVIGPDGTLIHELEQGDWAGKGDWIQTGKQSRLELTFPAETVIRFDEHTRFEVVSTGANEAATQPQIHIRLMSGKTWARVPDTRTMTGECSISSQWADTHARTATYWIDASHDDAVSIKVYSGTIKADRTPEQQHPEGTPAPTGSMAAAGQDISTVESLWSYIILPMQQIIVRADGLTTKPFRFPFKVDRSDWVLWNQKLDGFVKSPISALRGIPRHCGVR